MALDLTNQSNPYYYEFGQDLADCDDCYQVLTGPDNFEVVLTEPEDRTFGRDLIDVILKLNEQHAEIEKYQNSLQALVDCIMETRGPSAHKALQVARELLNPTKEANQ